MPPNRFPLEAGAWIFQCDCCLCSFSLPPECKPSLCFWSWWHFKSAGIHCALSSASVYVASGGKEPLRAAACCLIWGSTLLKRKNQRGQTDWKILLMPLPYFVMNVNKTSLFTSLLTNTSTVLFPAVIGCTHHHVIFENENLFLVNNGDQMPLAMLYKHQRFSAGKNITNSHHRFVQTLPLISCASVQNHHPMIPFFVFFLRFSINLSFIMKMMHVKNMEPVQDWTKEDVKMSLQRYPVGFLLKSGPLDQGFLQCLCVFSMQRWGAAIFALWNTLNKRNIVIWKLPENI